MSNLQVKGTDKDLPLRSTQVMLDSGLSYSMVPVEDIAQIEKSLADQGIPCEENHTGDNLELYQCECSDEKIKALKPFTFKAGEKTVELAVTSFLKKKDDNKCILLMYPSDQSLTVEYKWVVGDLFMQNFYSIFDWKNKRIGLVEPISK